MGMRLRWKWALGPSFVGAALVALLLALTALATGDEPTLGVLEATPPVVSPSDSVATADRTITITITDPDLSTTRFVGTGPDGEQSTFDLDGDGDRDVNDFVTVTLNESVGPSLILQVSLLQGRCIFVDCTVGNVGPGVEFLLPISPREHGGAIPGRDDIEIVDPDEEGVEGLTIGQDEVVMDWVTGAGYIEAVVRGPLESGDTFGLRWTSTLPSLTRDLHTFVETLAAPGDLVGGEAFTLDLNMDWLPLQWGRPGRHGGHRSKHPREGPCRHSRCDGHRSHRLSGRSRDRPG